MPPKKKGTASKVKETTTPKSTRATDPFITSKNGIERPSTAAATRSRRESAIVPPPSPAPKQAAAASKKRGPPAKSAVEDEPPKKRGRKAAVPAEPEPEDDDDAPKKRGPGRPRKNPAPAAKAATTTGKKRSLPQETEDADEEPAEDADDLDEPPPKKRGPGRPKKAARGRPKQAAAPAVPDTETAPPKSRGRPPKGGETTKVAADDGAAAEQLEDELMDTAAAEPEEDKEEAITSKRKAPILKKGRKGKARQVVAEEDGPVADAEDDLEESASGKNFWLMKAEQEDRDVELGNGKTVNTKFTIDDLRDKAGPEPWDGVRNATAAKNMRAMTKGDLAFFYASGGKSGRKPGIVGIMEIVKEHEPDASAWDEGSYAFVKEEKHRDKWCVVHVEFRKKLTKPVFLSELQKSRLSGGALENMQELKAARLSVSRVSEKEWDFINDNLIEGFEDEGDEGPGAAPTMAPKPTGPSGDLPGGIEEAAETAANDVVVEKETKITQQPNGEVVIDQTLTVEEEISLPNGGPVMPTTEDVADAPTTDGFLDATSATSRPASRAGSARPVSRQGSRQGSAAPPPRRGRSRTPKPLANGAPVASMTVNEEMEGIKEESELALA